LSFLWSVTELQSMKLKQFIYIIPKLRGPSLLRPWRTSTSKSGSQAYNNFIIPPDHLNFQLVRKYEKNLIFAAT
jgi:hypothetical protein